MQSTMLTSTWMLQSDEWMKMASGYISAQLLLTTSSITTQHHDITHRQEDAEDELDDLLHVDGHLCCLLFHC